MHNLVNFFKILADENRVRILALLSQRKMCVCELAPIIGVTQPSISRHLKAMKAANLLVEAQEGFWTNYALKIQDPIMQKIWQQMQVMVQADSVMQADLKVAQQSVRREVLCKQ